MAQRHAQIVRHRMAEGLEVFVGCRQVRIALLERHVELRDLSSDAGALGDFFLELESCERKLHEHFHFRTQNSGNDGLHQIVHGASGVAFEDHFGGLHHAGEKDEWRRSRALPLANQRSGFDTGDIGHLHVEQDHRIVAIEHTAQSLGSRVRAIKILTERFEDGFQRLQIGRLIVDHQNVDLMLFRHPALPLPTQRFAAQGPSVHGPLRVLFLPMRPAACLPPGILPATAPAHDRQRPRSQLHRARRPLRHR